MQGRAQASDDPAGLLGQRHHGAEARFIEIAEIASDVELRSHFRARRFRDGHEVMVFLCGVAFESFRDVGRDGDDRLSDLVCECEVARERRLGRSLINALHELPTSLPAEDVFETFDLTHVSIVPRLIESSTYRRFFSPHTLRIVPRHVTYL